ncbi:MAG: chemotaxis protein CheW [Leptospira sp.]|nr:chemotaxis protein CheW [Leptospira sp.]
MQTIISENEEKEGEQTQAEFVPFLSFQISGELFGIELLQVQEIIRTIYVTRVPNVEDYILGVINLRGEIIPVFDLKKRFDQGYTVLSPSCRFVVIEFESKRLGLLVEQVNQVIKIRKNQITRINDREASSFNNLVDLAGRFEDKIILLVDSKKLLLTDQSNI